MATTRSTATTRSMDAGALVLRVGVGGVIFAHGALKLFGWFGEGGGLDAVGAGFEQLGFTPGRTNALVAGVAETGGGALLALGLATPAAAAASAGTLAVAASFHAPNGYFFADGGLEFPATLALAAAAIGISGPGRFSVDGLLGGRFDRPWMRAVALGAVAPAASSVIHRRRRTLAARAADPAASADPVPRRADPDALLRSSAVDRGCRTTIRKRTDEPCRASRARNEGLLTRVGRRWIVGQRPQFIPRGPKREGSMAHLKAQAKHTRYVLGSLTAVLFAVCAGNS